MKIIDDCLYTVETIASNKWFDTKCKSTVKLLIEINKDILKPFKYYYAGRGKETKYIIQGKYIKAYQELQSIKKNYYDNQRKHN